MSSIRRLSMADRDRLISFMNANWGSEHPLVNNRTLFDHYYADGDMINFYATEEDGEIIAVCGYIPSSEKEGRDVWVSIWLAAKGHNGAGLQLMGKMKELTGASVISCNNIRENTMPFYTFLGYHPGKQDHWYRLRDLDSYRICRIRNRTIPDSVPAAGASLRLFTSPEEIGREFTFPEEAKPAKDLWYVRRRYFEYPYYDYLVYGVYLDGKCRALAAFRVNEGEEGNVLRLVDFIGLPSDISLLSGQIDPLMENYDCEYCDMYSRGVDGAIAGFVLRGPEDVNIIPNYLDPLLQKNIDYYYFTSDEDSFTMFRADGDQDRKNLG